LNKRGSIEAQLEAGIWDKTGGFPRLNKRGSIEA